MNPTVVCAHRLDTTINEQFQIVDPGSVSLFGDIGDGFEQLLDGRATGISFVENVTEFDSPSIFYGAFIMQILFEIDSANALITSIFGSSGVFITGHRIGDFGFFLPGERNDSPFSQDFECGMISFRCEQIEGSYGLNAGIQIPAPPNLSLFALGLLGIGLSRISKS